MSSRKLNSFPWMGVIILTILIGGYVGAYYQMLEIWSWRTGPGGTFGPPEPHYRWNHNYTRPNDPKWRTWLFAPMSWLDRRLRPHAWNPPEW